MIISASRRTDIPAYYSDWFYNRIKEGFVLVRNPMSFHRVSRVKLTPYVVDGIVFWTKNPVPMLERLDEIKGYMYYFQFTVTPYGKDIEPGVPANDETVSAFKRLSERIGAERVIWRFDPILLNAKYTADYHTRAFEETARELHRHTKKVIISFIDTDYKNVKSNLNALQLTGFTLETQTVLASRLAGIARGYGLAIETCAEKTDLREYGIGRARCIDYRLFEKLLSCELEIKKDGNQRIECGCASSIDIGTYNTCLNGCRYCYANYSPASVAANRARHNPLSPLLSGEIGDEDNVTDRKVVSSRSVSILLPFF